MTRVHDRGISGILWHDAFFCHPGLPPCRLQVIVPGRFHYAQELHSGYRWKQAGGSSPLFLLLPLTPTLSHLRLCRNSGAREIQLVVL
jgi:hypothetical protein